MKNRLSQSSGFTLLELLMVVIIVGILAALALPGYIRAAENARTAEVKTVLGQLKGSVQRYCAESEGVPPGGWGEIDMDDPTQDTVLSARWTFTFPTTMDCAPRPVLVQQVGIAVRAMGPCATSALDYDSTQLNPFVMNWAGSCT